MERITRSCLSIILAALMLISGFAALGEAFQTPTDECELTETQLWWAEDHTMFDSAWEQFKRVPMPEQSWFWIYELPENTYALFEPNQEELVISYLIIGEESALLWDTGLGIGNIRDCVEALTDLPVTVLNSHDHFDHIGGNALFDRIMCYNIDTAVETLTRGIPHEELTEWINPDAIVNPPKDFSADTFFTAGKSPTATVEDGEMIDLGGRWLEVMYTPGHDDAAIMLIDEQNGLLFTGDTWYPGWLYVFPEVCPLEQYLETMQNVGRVIRAKNIRQLYPSHNEIFPGTYRFDDTTAFMERVVSNQEEYEMIDGYPVYILDDTFAIMIMGLGDNP